MALWSSTDVFVIIIIIITEPFLEEPYEKLKEPENDRKDSKSCFQ